MYKTFECYSIAGVSNYALPLTCESIVNAKHDGTGLELFYPGKASRYTHLTSPLSATITHLTESPYSISGYVYPTWGLSEIAGVQTAFDSDVVGRFFKSEMDGEIYRVAEFTDANHIVLSQEYGGKHQAGRVKVIGSTDAEKKIVYGNVHTTNFAEWMIGKYIQIEGNGTTIFTIEAVDEDRQRLTIDAASNTGEDLIFSIQDNYEIDPPGAMILTILAAPSENDKIISVDYYQSHPPLTSPFDVPLLPFNYHWVLVAAALEMWLTENPVEGVTPDFYRARKERGIAQLMGHEDALWDAMHQSAEPDTVRLDGLSIIG